MESQLSLKITVSADIHIETLTQYVYDMALESENITLNKNKISSAIKKIFAEPKYGFYVSACLDNKLIGSLQVTFEYDYINDSTYYWIQSVFTHQHYRNRGIYTSNYKFVCETAKTNQVVAIKLSIDKTNERAKKLYKNLGMIDNGEEMWEIEFNSDESKDIDTSFYSRDDKHLFEAKKLDRESFGAIKDVKFRLVMGAKGTLVNYVGLEKLLSSDALGEAFIIEKDKMIIGLVGTFFEYSDWKDYLLYYVYDIRVNDNIDENELESVTAIIIEKVAEVLFKRGCGGFGFCFNNASIWMKGMLKVIGFAEPHYLIYKHII